DPGFIAEFLLVFDKPVFSIFQKISKFIKFSIETVGHHIAIGEGDGGIRMNTLIQELNEWFQVVQLFADILQKAARALLQKRFERGNFEQVDLQIIQIASTGRFTADPTNEAFQIVKIAKFHLQA